MPTAFSHGSRRVAILGGTFNPVHCGHLIMAEQALHQFGLDEVLWMPAGDPPHKPLAPGASSQDRLEMVKLAIADHDHFRWSDLEMQRPGRSFAVQTLEALHQQQPETQWHWVIGVDALQDLASWHQVDRVVKLCHWIVAPRVGSKTAEQVIAEVSAQLPIQAGVLQAPTIEISSTFLREQVRQGGSVRYLVPAAVDHYIRDHLLYAE